MRAILFLLFHLSIFRFLLSFSPLQVQPLSSVSFSFSVLYTSRSSYSYFFTFLSSTSISTFSTFSYFSIFSGFSTFITFSYFSIFSGFSTFITFSYFSTFSGFSTFSIFSYFSTSSSTPISTPCRSIYLPFSLPPPTHIPSLSSFFILFLSLNTLFPQYTNLSSLYFPP